MSLLPGDSRSLALVGNPGVEHVGKHFADAARSLDVRVRFCDSGRAYSGSPLVKRFNWWLRGHRPSRLRQFSVEVSRACAESSPRALLTTGIAPVEAEVLDAIGRSGVTRMNFLTDDPWNPAHKAAWFFQALRRYDVVYSPRESNMEDLRRHGCGDVRYLPFAYSPEIHFPEKTLTPEERGIFDADVVFAGGADSERIPYISALLQSGIHVALYGGYWSRYRETRAVDRGHASPATLRKAVGGARIALCLVRRANRDGHAMRTFELAAMGACILAEDTAEHRQILGPEGTSAVYFRSIPDMIKKARALLRDDGLRDRMQVAIRTRISESPNTYADRLMTVLGSADASRPAAASFSGGRQ